MGRKKKSRNRKPKTLNETPSPAAAVVSSSSAPAPETSSSAVPPPPPPPWVELPGDVTANILQRLGAEEMLCSAQLVCTTWWKVCQDPAMWRVIRLSNRERLDDEMCRYAVDRSQGELVDLTIDYFGDDELIHYIAERSSNLKRLTLISGYDISGASLAQAVKILPHLVELHLTIMDGVLAEDVEAIGFSCPKLESFSYNRRGCKIGFPRDPEDDEDFDNLFDRNGHAIAIGKAMPNLRHLQLFDSEMKNEGLEAILEGCPHLESLDLRQCFSLDLGGDLGKRCRGKIKDLKLPSDSISDIVWLAGESSDWDPYDSYESGWGSSDCDYDCYGDYETYDDYTSLRGYGYFDPDMAALFDSDDFF